MTKIGDPSLLATTKALDHLLDNCSDGFFAAVEDTRVGVALENLALLLSDSVSFLG